MTKLRSFFIGVLLVTAFLATPQGQDSIIRLTDAGWLVAAGNRVPLLLGSDGKGFINISETGAVTFINGATVTLPGGAFTGQLLGTVSATVPPYSFSGDTNTGYGSSAADTLALFAGGTTPRVTVTASIFTSALPFRAASSTAAAPGLSFTGNTDSGIFDVSGGVLGASAGGVNVFRWQSGRVGLRSDQTLDWASDTSFTSYDLSLSRLAAGSLGATAAGTAATSTDGFSLVNSTAALVGAQVQISRRGRLTGAGWDLDDAVSRAVSFFTEVLPVAGNTVSGEWKLGFIDPVASTITYPLVVNSAGQLTSLGAYVGPAGSAAATTFNFGTAGTGLLGSSTTIGMAMGGTERFRWTDSAQQVMQAAATLNWTDGAIGGSIDLTLTRLAADVVAVGANDAYGLASKAWINTAPSGPVACTTPAVTWHNGSASFQIDVGGTCTGVTTLVVTLPAATNAYSCTATNVTTSATAAVEMTASTSTSATFTNYTRTTGVALDWVDGADVRVSCTGG